MTPTTERAGDVEKETKTGPMSPARASAFWQAQLELSDREHKDWIQDGQKIEQRFRAKKGAHEKTGKGNKQLNILYSNTETLKAALYARTPKPDARRRFLDRNPVARMGADIIERCLAYCADSTEHDRAYKRAVQDNVLPGRGVVRYEYEPEIGDVPVIDPMTGQPAVDPMTGQPMTKEGIIDQEVCEEYVYWCDFRHSPARTWCDVWWVAFRHRMTRDDLIENGFEEADKVPLNWSPEVDDKRATDRNIPDDLKRAEVWEIWDNRTKHRYWIVKGHQKALRVDEDPYGLDEFWPMAEPLYAVLGNETLIPTPDYHQYQDQAEDLDEVTARISVLTKALKRRGVYDATVPELKRLARAGDNEFIPSPNMQQLASKGGLQTAFQTEDISVTASVLLELYKQRDQLIQSIYEVTGISDIMRGQSNASETATAQNIKAQFGSMRLKDRQREVQRWVRDGYRIKAELIVEHFEPAKIAEMAGMDPNDPTFQQAVKLIKSDKARSYQIDIETDSTVFEDAEQEKQSRVELLTAMGGFAQQWMPVVQAAPEMMPLVGEMLAFGARGFKAARSLEDKIDEVMQAIQQRMSQPPQPPPPDPAVEKVKAEMQRDEQTHQMDMATKQIDFQMKQQDAQTHQFKALIDVEKARAMADAKQPAIGPDGRMMN
jgi:hypothetical protein